MSAMFDVLYPNAVNIISVKDFLSFEQQLSELICNCLLYTSDAADEEDSVDLGGRRIN